MHPYQIIKNITIPYKTEFSKTRIGLEKDGAYVLLHEPIEQAEAVVSLGIGDNVEFDLDILKRHNKTCYMADYSIESEPVKNDKFLFKKIFINSKTFVQFLEEFDLLKNNNMILKIDIEGGEYETLQNLDKDKLLKFSQIGAEFHNLLTEPWKYIELLNRLNQHFYITHLHANNIGHIHEGIPDTIEISFIRKDLVKKPIFDNSSCPDPKLDFKNHSEKMDYILDWWVKSPEDITHTINQWYGRLGNNIQQISNAIYYCHKNKINFYSPPHEFINQIGIKFGKKTSFSSRFFFFEKHNNDFECEVQEINSKRREICKRFITPSLKMRTPIFEQEAYGDDTIVIHIRSGDIFSNNPHALYVQNPLWYYNKIIEQFDRAIVVTESDFANPVLQEISKNKKVEIRTGSLEEDFEFLMRAKNLATSGVSTFSIAAALCSQKIKTLYCSDIFLTEHLNPTMLYNTDVEVKMINIKNYIKIGEWKNTSEQRLRMISYNGD